jgi:hypothetical protein
VALKVLPFIAAVDPRHLQRFRNEAQAAAQLHHTNIVPVFAVGAEAGVHFYAMQFIDGQSLAQLLNQLRGKGKPAVGPQPLVTPTILPPPTARATADAIASEHTSRSRGFYKVIAGLIRQAAEALEYAHQVGIVHRDVKPANLLLDAGGRLWVTDFGLAQIRNDAGLTATGELVGTIRYMSPEQALGMPGLVDHRTDIYSLGVTLYELLTLSPLFEGDDRGTLLHKLANADPRLPRAVDRTIPVELETIVLKAIAKVPADRYASAGEFAADLRRFLENRPVLARRPSLVDRAAKWTWRHRGATLAALLGLTLAAVGFAISTAIIAQEHSKTQDAYDRERRASERERARAQEATDRQAEAEANYLRTKRAVDLFVELSDEELLAFPPLATVRQRLLEAAVAYYQELNDARANAVVRVDLEETRARLRRMQAELVAMNEVNTTMLLDQAAVRADLGLDPKQASNLALLLTQLKANQVAPAPDSRGDKRSQLVELAAQSRKKLDSILTTAQYRRLRQLYLQLPGPHIFTPDVLEQLELAPEQKQAARQINVEATQASLRLVASAKKPEEGRAQMESIWRAATPRLVELLTPEQRQRWAELTGAPATAAIHFPWPNHDQRGDSQSR